MFQRYFFGGWREAEYDPSSNFKNTSGRTANVMILICMYGEMSSPREAILTVFVRIYSQCSFHSAIFVLSFPKIFRSQLERELWTPFHVCLRLEFCIGLATLMRGVWDIFLNCHEAATERRGLNWCMCDYLGRFLWDCRSQMQNEIERQECSRSWNTFSWKSPNINKIKGTRLGIYVYSDKQGFVCSWGENSSKEQSSLYLKI